MYIVLKLFTGPNGKRESCVNPGLISGSLGLFKKEVSLLLLFGNELRSINISIIQGFKSLTFTGNHVTFRSIVKHVTPMLGLGCLCCR